MSSEAEDTLTIQRLLAEHSPSALEHLYQYARLLEIVLNRRFGAYLDEEDCRDIVADTLIHAWQTGERWNPEFSSVKTWLIMLAIYRAREFLRRNGASRSISLDMIDLDTRGSEEAQEQPQEQPVEYPSVKIKRLLDHLPTRRALVIKLYYYEGRTMVDIARIMRITEAAVRSHLSHGRASLRRALQAEAIAA